MDAFAVSITNGLCYKNMNKKQSTLIAFSFGFFQGLMPLIGYYIGSLFEEYIEPVDHWIAFGLLFLIGFKMIYDAVKDISAEDELIEKQFSCKSLLVQSIATSIDAFMVGLTFVAFKMNIFGIVSIIFAITFSICLLGVFLGGKVGSKFGKKAEIVGGTVLILIGVKIVIEHLLF